VDGGRFSPESINSSRPATPAESSISVQLATDHDRDHLGALLRSAIEQARGTRGGKARLRHLGESPEQFLESVFSSGGPVVFLARIGETVCGFATLAQSEPRLELVFVDPAQRRHGVARALVAAAEVVALTRWNAPLIAVVAAGSRSEKSLFEALGYRAELLVMERRDTSSST
jgi:GNAT superfamily N-acetyltransferase